jgi:hypothetical protein
MCREGPDCINVTFEHVQRYSRVQYMASRCDPNWNKGNPHFIQFYYSHKYRIQYSIPLLFQTKCNFIYVFQSSQF